MKNKSLNKITALLCVGLLLSSCGGEYNSTLEELENKKSELKAELEEIEAKIEEFDTTVSVTYPLVNFDTLKRRSFVHKIEVQGTVEAELDALINAEASGIITTIYVKEGQKVSAGQTLAMVDAEILGKNLEEIEASLELANYVYEKQKDLYEKGISSEFEYEQARNNKISLEKRLQTLKTQKGKYVVQAPFSGEVDMVFAKQGSMASPQTPILRLVNNNTVRMTAGISERHLKSVKEGTPVELHFSLLDTVIHHVITSRGSYIDPTNRTFRIISLIKNNKFLLPNLAGKILITDVSEKNVLVVRSESIILDLNNKPFIYLMHPSAKGEKELYEIEKVFVEEKSSYEGMAWIEIEKPVKEGTLVVTQGAKGITESDIVRVN